jgi:hypothetical protein
MFLPARYGYSKGSEWLDYHYENIAKLSLTIAKYDEVIQDYARFTSEYLTVKTAGIRARRQEAIDRLHLLRERWPKIAGVLREESRKLFVLPRERAYCLTCRSGRLLADAVWQ